MGGRHVLGKRFGSPFDRFDFLAKYSTCVVGEIVDEFNAFFKA